MPLAFVRLMANPIEQFSAKAMGTVKAVVAGFNGLRGVFLHLAEEHGEVSALMKRVSKSDDAEVRRSHWPQIRRELLAHEHGEASQVYSALREHEATRDIAIAHEREAGQLEAAVAAVDAHDPASETWVTAFDHVFGLVQRHAETEESVYFPRAQAAFGEEQTKVLLDRYEAAKKMAKGLV